MAGQPWPGERLRPYDFDVRQSSATLAGEIWNLDPGGYAADETCTLQAGDEFDIRIAGTRLLLESDLIGECNWILEVVSGTIDVEVTEMVDPQWNYDPAGYILGATHSGKASVGSRFIEPVATEHRGYQRLAQMDDSLLLRVRVTAGSASARVLTLQAEPPHGLQRMAGTTWSDWITPPEVTRAAPQQFGRFSRQGNQTYTPWDGTSGTVLINQVYQAATTTIEDFGPPAPAVVNGLAVGVGWTNSFDAFGGATPPAVNARARAGVSGTKARALWTEDPTLRLFPENFGGGAVPPTQDRDWTGTYEWNPNMTTDSVGWVPAFVVPTGDYYEAAPGGTVHVASPQDATLSISGGVSWSGTVAVGGWEVEGEIWNPAVVLPVTGPTGGDLEFDTSIALEEFSPPTSGADWGSAEVGGSVTMGSGQITFEYALRSESDPNYYTSANPSIRYQMPDYRYEIPVWELSPDAIGAVPGPGGEYLHPKPDLAGELDRVRVWHAR